MSPLIGFIGAALLLLAAKALLRNPALFTAPEGNKPPPGWIRGLLVLTCTGVSFAHGSNDGQKGMGLIVLILVGIVPTAFALDLSTTAQTMDKIRASAVAMEQTLQGSAPATALTPDAAHKTLTEFLRHGELKPQTVAALAAVNGFVNHDLQGVSDFNTLPRAQRPALRLNIYLVSETLTRLTKAKKLPSQLKAADVDAYTKTLKSVTNFIPTWVKFAGGARARPRDDDRVEADRRHGG